MPPEPAPETQQFNDDVQFLLKANNPHARSLLAFIHRTIRQFELGRYVTEIDIFVEAYLRGVRYTSEHQTQIREPKAWIRSTAYNIIREYGRDRLRYSTVAFDELMEQGRLETHIEPPLPDPSVDSSLAEDGIQRVIQAFQSLTKEDSQLIHWKVVENLAWADIQARLQAETGETISLATLRKRGQRALERLRQAYHIHE
ncbi:MAG: RNA polymerase sigma factor [Nodosilinea sp.]